MASSLASTTRAQLKGSPVHHVGRCDTVFVRVLIWAPMNSLFNNIQQLISDININQYESYVQRGQEHWWVCTLTDFSHFICLHAPQFSHNRQRFLDVPAVPSWSHETHRTWMSQVSIEFPTVEKVSSQRPGNVYQAYHYYAMKTASKQGRREKDK